MLRPVGIASLQTQKAEPQHPLDTVEPNYLNTKVFVPIPEINKLITEYNSIDDNAVLAKTCWFHRNLHEEICKSKLKKEDPRVIALFEEGLSAQAIFLKNPQYWLDEHVPRHEIGVHYLKSLQIDGPLICRKIARGALTIREVQNLLEEIINALWQDETYHRFMINGGRADGVIKYCIEGSLSLEDAKDLPLSVINHLNDEKIQVNLDNGSIAMPDAIKFAISLEQ